MATTAPTVPGEPPVEPRPLVKALTPPTEQTDAATLWRSFLDHLRFSRGKIPETATTHDRFLALSHAVRDRLAERWVNTQRSYYAQDVKRAYYLSAEYLLGRALANNL